MGRCLMVLIVMATVSIPALAHQELYHNVDVDLTETARTGAAEVSFTVHAPELLVGFAEGADAMFDDRWLRERSDAELERIVTLSREYLAGRFAVRPEGGAPVDLAARLVFEDFERMRGAGAEELPPACVLARLRLDRLRGGGRLEIDHAAGSDKRLVLVVLRAKAFPEVIDVEAGSSAAVELPEIERGGRGPAYAVLVLVSLAAFGWLQAKRGERLAKRMEESGAVRDRTRRSR